MGKESSGQAGLQGNGMQRIEWDGSASANPRREIFGGFFVNLSFDQSPFPI